MACADITNPATIKFLVESYEKTEKLRMRWNDLHEAELKDTATFRGPEKGWQQKDVAKVFVEAGLLTMRRDHISSQRNRIKVPITDGAFIPGIADFRKGHSIVDIGLGDPKDDPRLVRPSNDLTPDPIMRPVPPEQSKIIYKNLPYFGRMAYLKSRNSMKPEDKYYFRETSGWECGWRLKDSIFGRSGTRCGRTAKLTVGRKSRAGPQADPPHYRYPEIPGSHKCGR